MARGKNTPFIPQPAQLSAEEIQRGIIRLTKRLEAVKQFDPASVKERFESAELTKLVASIDEGLISTFGADTTDYARYRSAADFDWGPISMGGAIPMGRVHSSLARSKSNAVALLEQAIEGLQERLSEMEPSQGTEAPRASRAVEQSNRVFIVHGQEGEPKQAVARFLEGLDLEAVILEEQPNRGNTIIEKFETYSDVGFAVVLLTPDDVGRAKTDADLKPRARQNVILELGFFVGKLGRDRVCALKMDEVEVPSDISGVVYVAYDRAGGWKTKLGLELQEAGYEIDWNKVMRR